MDVTHNNLNAGTVNQSGVQTAVNVIALLTVLAGSIFKVMHWPGADMLIMASTIFLLATVIFLCRDTQLISNDGLLALLVSALMFALILSAMFKRFHWPAANILIVVAAVAAVLSAFYMIFKKNNVGLPNQFGVTVILYIIYIMGAISFLSMKTQEVLETNLPH